MKNSRRTSRGPVQLMPRPGTGPRPGGWETLHYKEEPINAVVRFIQITRIHFESTMQSPVIVQQLVHTVSSGFNGSPIAATATAVTCDGTSWSACAEECQEFGTNILKKSTHSCHITRVGTLIVATIYLQLIQNRYMFRSFTILQCSHQHCVQPVASDVEVLGYL